MRLQRVNRVFSAGFVSRVRTEGEAICKELKVLHSKVDSTGGIVTYRAYGWAPAETLLVKAAGVGS
jgi:hypothetical protein